MIPRPAYFAGGLITAAIVTFALRPNIKRVLAGEERVVGPAAKAAKKGSDGAAAHLR